jgi:hypothetical protein
MNNHNAFLSCMGWLLVFVISNIDKQLDFNFNIEINRIKGTSKNCKTA